VAANAIAAGAGRAIFMLLALLGGCAASPSSPPARNAIARPEALAPADAGGHEFDAYGPRQYSVFGGVNRDRVFRAATGPATGPADDSVLVPVDDGE
jgi:hypothetical protein